MHLDELLSVYLDGEATAPEGMRVEAHLGECHRCRRRMEEINAARTAVRSLPMMELPAGLSGVGMEAPTGPRRRTAVWAGAAAAITAAVIAVAALVTPSPEPLDIDHVSLQLDARSSLDVGAASLKVMVPTQEPE